jgi:GLPGLI family protein
MKNFIKIYLIFIAVFNLSAQEKMGKINYDSYLFGNLTKSTLIFNGSKSLYFSNRGPKKDFTLYNVNDTLNTEDPEALSKIFEGNHSFVTINEDEEGNLVYVDRTSKKLIERKVLRQQPIILDEGSIPTQKWKLKTGTKKIGKYLCKEASCTFRGRNYTAWYTTEIPLALGPVKFHGLPGLILQISDEDNNYVIKMSSVEYPSTDKSLVAKIVPPKTGLKTTKATYFKTLMKLGEEIVKKKEALAAERGGYISMPNPYSNEMELNFDLEK